MHLPTAFNVRRRSEGTRHLYCPFPSRLRVLTLTNYDGYRRTRCRQKGRILCRPQSRVRRSESARTLTVIYQDIWQARGQHLCGQSYHRGRKQRTGVFEILLGHAAVSNLHLISLYPSLPQRWHETALISSVCGRNVSQNTILCGLLKSASFRPQSSSQHKRLWYCSESSSEDEIESFSEGAPPPFRVGTIGNTSDTSTANSTSSLRGRPASRTVNLTESRSVISRPSGSRTLVEEATTKPHGSDTLRRGRSGSPNAVPSRSAKRVRLQSRSPSPPPEEELNVKTGRKVVRSRATEIWMLEYYRYHLARGVQWGVMEFGKRMSKKTGGAIGTYVFQTFRKGRPKELQEIETEFKAMQ
ncbi:hypothetical protein BKA62DRAFT_491493 [Auriculariales sp. MPI-PUGE-AT-0066]|nr:hypothetical protein BKA62DRAFT_491493 [Auriculariales sp. MPI-PUGE-AT-0066]